jgi:hypothetical protein
MVLTSLARCAVLGAIVLGTLLSAGQPVEGQRVSDSGASLVDVTVGKARGFDARQLTIGGIIGECNLARGNPNLPGPSSIT